MLVYHKYSASQLEKRAEQLLQEYDPERLTKTKPIDVYDVIEKCLDVPYDWKYLTPDQSVLGMTAFNSGYIWVWDKPSYQEGDLPHKAIVEKGTILIDSTLTEGDNRGRENFTVMHEVFHQIIHQKEFSRCKADYIHHSTAESINGKKRLVDGIDFIEYQANTCAAAFLMPKRLVEYSYRLHNSSTWKLSVKSWEAQQIIEKLAPEFNVSKQAMQYRLINLNLMRE